MRLIQIRWATSEYEIESDGFRLVSFVHFWTFPALFHKFITKGRRRVSEHSFRLVLLLLCEDIDGKTRSGRGKINSFTVDALIRLDGRAQCCMQRDIEPNEKQKDQCSVIILRCQRVRWKVVQDDIFALVVRAGDFHCPFNFFSSPDFPFFFYFQIARRNDRNKLWNSYSVVYKELLIHSWLFIN